MINQLFRPVSIVPLVVFRMCFGLIAFLDVCRSFYKGIIKSTYIDPIFTFPFMDFTWLQPLPGNGMYWYFIVVAVLALMVMLGAYYRIAITSYFILWTAAYLMQKSYNSNYYYLILVLSFILIFTPAHRKFSIDVFRNKKIEIDTCPQWCHWIFIFQTSLLYFHAGVAKLYPDWLNGKAMASIVRLKGNFFLIGPYLLNRWIQLFIAYAGVLFDLIIVPALLWKKTRNLALFCTVLFHLFNSYVFRVGLFPYMTMSMVIFFLSPDGIKKAFSKWIKPKNNNEDYSLNFHSNSVKYGIILWAMFQFYLPLRHFFYEGAPQWTEEGNRHSWRVMFRTKGGFINFLVKDLSTQNTWKVDPKEFLTPSQVFIVATKPDVCWQFVQFLKTHYKKTKNIDEIEIYAISTVYLNGGKPSPLYKQDINLANVEWKMFGHSEWINSYPETQE